MPASWATRGGCAAYAQQYQRMNMDYAGWSQACAGGMTRGGRAGAAPGYDPNNVLGPTHQDRMDAIAGFGAQAQQGFQDRMNQMDIQQQQFLGTLND